MSRMRTYKWSFLSLGTSIGVTVFVISVAEYLHWKKGIALGDISAANWIGPLQVIALVFSLVAAVKGVRREPAPHYGIVAVLVGLLGLLFAIR